MKKILSAIVSFFTSAPAPKSVEQLVVFPGEQFVTASKSMVNPHPPNAHEVFVVRDVIDGVVLYDGPSPSDSRVHVVGARASIAQFLENKRRIER